MSCPTLWNKIFGSKTSAESVSRVRSSPASSPANKYSEGAKDTPELPTMSLNVAPAALDPNRATKGGKGGRRPSPLNMVSVANNASPTQSPCGMRGLATSGDPQDHLLAPDKAVASSFNDNIAAFGSALKLIREGLFIGDLGCMMSKEWLKQGITAIVTIMPSLPEEVLEVTEACPGVKHFHYMLDDHIEYGDKDRHNISTLYADSPHKNIFDVLEFMHDARLDGESVMVHCEQGKRRSATVMAAYLIWYLNMSRKESIQVIQAARRGATIPGIWREELEYLAERRATLDEALAAKECEFDRVLSSPNLRVQLEHELKRKVQERRATLTLSRPMTPTSDEEDECPVWALPLVPGAHMEP